MFPKVLHRGRTGTRVEQLDQRRGYTKKPQDEEPKVIERLKITALHLEDHFKITLPFYALSILTRSGQIGGPTWPYIGYYCVTVPSDPTLMCVLLDVKM